MFEQVEATLHVFANVPGLINTIHLIRDLAEEPGRFRECHVAGEVSRGEESSPADHRAVQPGGLRTGGGLAVPGASDDGEGVYQELKRDA